MSRLRFVHPIVVRLALSDGDFVDIKNELTAGEERASYARMTKVLEAGCRPQLDPEQVELATLVAYVVNWSFTDQAGSPVPVTESALKQLDADTFKELYTAIETHERALADQKKTSRAAAIASSAISPSPDACTGPTTT